MELMSPNISKLRDFYHSSIVAKAFLSHAARRERDQSETKGDSALLVLRSEGFHFRRRDMIDLFRKLEELGCGRFVEGRYGWPSRFVWSVGLRSVAKAAAGGPSSIEQIPTEEEAAGLPHYPVDDGEDGDEILAHIAAEIDRIEGLDENRTIGWGDYPLDSVFVRTEQRTVGEVVRRIRADRYDLNPDFQREFLWPQD